MIVFANSSLPQAEPLLASKLPEDIRLICSGDFDTVETRREQFRKAEIAYGNIPASWLDDAPNLRWLQLESAGFDAYLNSSAKPWRNQVVVTNLRGFFAASVAETLVTGVLALNRCVPDLVVLQRGAKWDRDRIRPSLRLLDGQNAVILGAGSIGLRVQKLLDAFGCSSKIFARTSPDAELKTATELDEALPSANLVVGCLPDTPETKGLFGRDRLAKMNPSAVLANGGRGSLIDEAALIDALHQKKLGGAVLDVTSVEPLPADHPFWSCPNLLITQHTGGWSSNEIHGKIAVFCRNLDRYRRGETLDNQVNFDRGY